MNLKLVLSILLAAACITAFVIATNIQSKNKEFLLVSGKSTQATLYKTAGSHFKFRYTVDGVSYNHGKKQPYEYLQDGEMYELLYDENDPERIYLNFKNPIIPPNFSTTSPSSISTRTGGSTKFTYEVDGNEYTRICWPEIKPATNPTNYVVKYNPNNVRIGYLVRKDGVQQGV